MTFKFEKLDVWKIGIEYANDVHLLTREFPKEEMFSLSSQFKRASDSISLNIAEGATGNTTPDSKDS
jgi:four helix bundle protein